MDCSHCHLCRSFTMAHILLILGTLLGLVIAQDASINYSVTEESRTGAIVGNVRQDSGVNDRYPAEVLSVLQFVIIRDEDTQSPGGQLFQINIAGDIITTGRIDREAMCPSKVTCTVKLDIQVQPIEYFQIIKTEIEILDINDQVPRFPEASIVLSLSEAAKVGSALTLPLADDTDSPQYGVTGYVLLDSQSTFELNVKTNSDGSKVAQLVLLQEVDRETQESYALTVRASDGGSPAKTALLQIDIQIIDVNDNPTVFERDTYEVSVPEDVSINTQILQVTANDADISGSLSLFYSLSSKSQTDYGHLFKINNQTGAIFIIGELDFEAENEYVLDVMAQDQSPGAIATVAKVTIRVLDRNDNAPKIKLNSVSSSGHAQISEFATRGSFVAHVKVVDLDSGDNGKFHCALDSEMFALEQLYPTEFKLVTAATFDRELKADYSVTLTCTDLGSSPLTSNKLIPITILDENDNEPEFQQVSYEYSILENSNPGSSIVQLAAVDRDFGDNALITYHIDELSGQFFDIDAESGVISTIRELDYEQTKSYTIHASAQDSGNPPQSTSVIVLINVIDTDDEHPTFSQTHYTFVLHENEPIQTEVGQVNAVDRDSEDFNDFHFELSLDTESSSKFAINRLTGMIYSEARFDREETALYTFSVLAVSAGIKPTTSTAIVTVYIADVNDHRPVIQFPNGQNDTVYIPSNLPQGEAITQIQATDQDTGTNAHLTYSIQAGESKDLFVMDTSSGFVFVGGDISTDLEYEIHTLSIRVQDGGVPPKTANTILNIVVNRSDLYPNPNKLVANENLTIVIVIACMSGFLVVVLVIAIAAIIWQQRKKQRKHTQIGRVLQHHSITIEPSQSGKSDHDDMRLDNHNNDQLDMHRDYPKKKFSKKSNVHRMEEGERDDHDMRKKKGVSFADHQRCETDEDHMRPLTIQTGAMDLPVEDKDSGCSMDTSNCDSGPMGCDDVFDHPSNRPYMCSSPNHRPSNNGHSNGGRGHKPSPRKHRVPSSPAIHTHHLEPGRHGNRRDSHPSNEPKLPPLPPRENRKSAKNISQMFARDVLYRDVKKTQGEGVSSVCKVHGVPTQRTEDANSVNLHEISSEVHV